MIILKIDEDSSGIKPLTFLKKKLDLPFYVLKLLIDKKKILLNSKELNNDFLLKEGDIITINDDRVKLRKKREYKIINLNQKIIFEDDIFLVLNKSPFVMIQGDGSESYNIYNHLEYLKNVKNLSFLAPIHRLDKNTSGVLICVKNQVYLRELHRLLKNKSVKKIYHCLVKGVPNKKNGVIEGFLEIRDNAKEKVVFSNNRKLGKKFKYSFSRYRLIRTFNFKINFKKYRLSLLEVDIETGITHQIRVHLKRLGVPVVGDDMYGDGKFNDAFFKVMGLKKRQLLHSKKVCLLYKNREYQFIADYYDDMKKIIKKLKG